MNFLANPIVKKRVKMGKYIPTWDSYIPGIRFIEGENAGRIGKGRI